MLRRHATACSRVSMPRSHAGGLASTMAVALVCALAAGCNLTRRIGDGVCGIAACDGGADASIVWPIDDASFTDLDPQAFRLVAEQVSGVWYGLIAGFEGYGPP